MTLGGWFVMLVSCGVVLGLVVFCFYRVLTTPRSTEHMHAPLDIDTRDTEE
jgi:hypothetical protein